MTLSFKEITFLFIYVGFLLTDFLKEFFPFYYH